MYLKKTIQIKISIYLFYQFIGRGVNNDEMKPLDQSATSCGEIIPD